MKDSIKIGSRDFDLRHRTYIMGILNVTPDSFSDGGKFNSIDNALMQVEKMVEEGADIIDIGGESTRPNHIKITEDEEIERVVPYIDAVKSRFDVPISIDTYKAKVASVAVEHGVDLINDIWGLKWKGGELAEVIARSNLPCCLMHNRDNRNYHDFVRDVIADLEESVNIAINAGVDRNKIILDPGVGFAKDLRENLIITKHMGELMSLDLPVLLGTSRKSMIGNTLDLPVDERVEGTIATSVMAVVQGVNFVRVHDIKENKRAIDMAMAIMNSDIKE